MSIRTRKRGLILLVVLGMLSLFSLLAVTYVVFSGAARTSSLQMARRDFRGTPPDRLLDHAIKQVIRGTKDLDSALWRQSLLEDYYGGVVVNTNSIDDSPINVAPVTGVAPGDILGPQLFTNTYLKIRLAANTRLPVYHDALVGRILTFTTGPLQNLSFPILRSFGTFQATELTATPALAAVQNSVLIDVSRIKDKPVTVNSVTRFISDWITVQADGDALVYQNYTSSPMTGGFGMFINSGALNGTGMGVRHENPFTSTGLPVTVDRQPNTLLMYTAQGSTQFQVVAPFNQIPDALQPNQQQTNLVTRIAGQSYIPIGDTDEAYDAADFNNFFLALRRSAAASSDDVTPSFHRPDVINYLAGLDASYKLNLYDTIQARPLDAGLSVLSFLQAVQRATARPLSLSLLNIPIPDGSGSTTPISFQLNSQFTGTNGISAAGGALRDPQLTLDWSKITNQPDNPAQQALDTWLRWQLRGPWDVDNDGDGVMDSVWVDLNYPLSTSPDGKLLKILAAFYIEDMDGKLDINAAGAQVQATAAFPMQLPLNAADQRFAYLPNATNNNWPQGMGTGPADISLRHLFDSDSDLQKVLALRYASSSTDEINYNLQNSSTFKPGQDRVDDAISQLIAHQSGAANSMHLQFHQNNRLPGLPRSTNGRMGVAFDLLGNPMLMNTSVFSDTLDDPYETSVLSGGRYDRLISIAEWERLARYNDLDRSSLPATLELAAGTSLKLANSNFRERIRSLSPRNVTTTLPRISRVYRDVNGTDRRVASFVEFVEEYLQRRYNFRGQPFAATQLIQNNQFAQLFPLEFQQNRPLDLNRALGNGVDDDNDGSVDEPDELATNTAGVVTQIEPYPGGSTTSGNYTQGRSDFDPGWDPQIVNGITSSLNVAQFSQFSGSRSRQLMARHLYCLAQLILPVNPTTQVNEYIFPNQPDPTTPVDNETRARILAQWAVNVVDYRDADAAMTRFSYDPDPFRYIPSNPPIVPQASLTPAWNPDSSHVVFGFEQPELLVTESLATHDVRVKRRTTNPQIYDQMRLPEGSLFLEFLCPRTTSANNPVDNLMPGVPQSLYGQTATTAPQVLDLGRLSPPDANNVQYPIWRVVITEPRVDTTNASNPIIEKDEFTTLTDNDDIDPAKPQPTVAVPTPQTPTSAKGVNGFNYTYQVGNSGAGLKWRVGTTASDIDAGTPLPEPKIDRVLWFSGLAPTAANAALPGVTDPELRVYNYREGNTLLQGGQYLVVGPRPVTYFGSKSPNTMPREHTPNNHRIALRWDDPDGSGQQKWEWVQIYNRANIAAFWIPNTSPYKATDMKSAVAPLSSYVRPCVTMVAGANMPTDWTADAEITQTYVGLNISEPNPIPGQYYAQPTNIINTADTATDPDNKAPGYKNMSKDGYLDMAGGTTSGSKVPYDTDRNGTAGQFLAKHGWPISNFAGSPAHPTAQTQRNWSAAVVQRLADPSLPWHEALNPYITVDWQSIDLTVFSGEDQPAAESDYYFATRAKSGRHTKVQPTTGGGGSFERVLGEPGETFFSYETSFPETPTTEVTYTNPPVGVTITTFFKQELLSEHYTDDAYPYPNTTDAEKIKQRGTLAITSANKYDSQLSTLGYLNRSYDIRTTTHPDFTGTPAIAPHAPYHPNANFSSPLELASVTLSSPGSFANDFYFEPIGQTPPAHRTRHTLDFETHATPTSITSKYPYSIADMWDVVNVGSLWPDAWKVIEPAQAAATGTNIPRDKLFEAYQAPMNLIPTHREPGRVNLNTATEPMVFKGLMGNIMAPADRIASSTTPPPFQTNMRNALQAGYATASSVLDARATTTPSGNPHLDSGVPTQIAGVFTNPANALMFPTDAQLQQLNPLLTTAPVQRLVNPTDRTLLRHFPALPGNGARMFNVDANNLPALLDLTATPISPIKNTFAHNYAAARMANMTTDRSNVFAVRVTLAYFEYDPALGIGAEYGSDQGRSARHRGFYLIDRSIPVGFKQGEDFNTNDVILSRRIIE